MRQRTEQFPEEIQGADEQVHHILEEFRLVAFEAVTDELKAPSENEGRNTHFPIQPDCDPVQDRKSHGRYESAACVDRDVIQQDCEGGRNRQIDRTDPHEVEKAEESYDDERDPDRVGATITNILMISAVFAVKLFFGHLLKRGSRIVFLGMPRAREKSLSPRDRPEPAAALRALPERCRSYRERGVRYSSRWLLSMTSVQASGETRMPPL